MLDQHAPTYIHYALNQINYNKLDKYAPTQIVVFCMVSVYVTCPTRGALYGEINRTQAQEGDIFTATKQGGSHDVP